MSKLKKQCEQRSAARQRDIARLWAAGPRVVMEAMLEVSSGKCLDSVLAAYTRIPVSTYRALGADALPIHQAFEAALRKVVAHD